MRSRTLKEKFDVAVDALNKMASQPHAADCGCVTGGPGASCDCIFGEAARALKEMQKPVPV